MNFLWVVLWTLRHILSYFTKFDSFWLIVFLQFASFIHLIFSKRAKCTCKYCFIYISLKHGFCNKSFRKDEPLTSWTLFSTYLSSKLDSPLIKTLERENLILMINMLKKCSTCVHLVRVSSFRNNLLQNPYFSIYNWLKQSKFIQWWNAHLFWNCEQWACIG